MIIVVGRKADTITYVNKRFKGTVTLQAGINNIKNLVNCNVFNLKKVAFIGNTLVIPPILRLKVSIHIGITKRQRL